MTAAPAGPGAGLTRSHGACVTAAVRGVGGAVLLRKTGRLRRLNRSSIQNFPLEVCTHALFGIGNLTLYDCLLHLFSPRPRYTSNEQMACSLQRGHYPFLSARFEYLGLFPQ